MKQQDGKLLNGKILYRQSPHHKALFEPRYVVIHYTEGPTAEGAIVTLTQKNSPNNASAHFVIDIDGEATQLVDLNRAANHAGRSYWLGLQGLSRYSFGLEVVNEGRFAKTRTASGDEVWKGPSTRLYSSDDVFIGPHRLDNKVRGWKTYPQEQLEKVYELTDFLVKEFNLVDVLGHDKVSPFSGQSRRLITVWFKVRILAGPLS